MPVFYDKNGPFILKIRMILTSSTAGSKTNTSPSPVVIQIEPGLGGPCTPNIWQHTNLRNFIIQRNNINTREKVSKLLSILCTPVHLRHKVFNLRISVPSYISLIWLHIMMIPIAIIMHLRTNVPVPLCQTTQHHIPHSPQQPQISHANFLSPTTVRIWYTQKLYKIYSVLLWVHMAPIGVRGTRKHCGRVFGRGITALNFCYYLL